MNKQADKPAGKAKDAPQGKAMDQAQPETVASVAKPKAKGQAKAMKVADVTALAVEATGADSAVAKPKGKFQAKKKAAGKPKGRGKK